MTPMKQSPDNENEFNPLGGHADPQANHLASLIDDLLGVAVMGSLSPW
jgi:hypothetical protein